MPAGIAAVDSLEITVLVDNVTDSLSSGPGFVETEFAGLRRRGMQQLAGSCLCCAAHGFACLVTARRGGASHTLLFDAGPEDAVFARNAQRLGVDLGAVEGVMLSHGHWDHGGALPRALQLIRQRNGGGPVPTYLHPEMFALRAVKAPDGSFHEMEPVPGPENLAGHGAAPIVTRAAETIGDGAFYISGEIPRVTPFEKGFPNQHRRLVDGSWEKDEVMPDERYLAVNIAGKGLFVFSACSHAGLINVLTDARARFPQVPLYGVLGGFHLSGATEPIIPQTVAALRGFDLKLIAAAHCTGWRAVNALATAFGEALVPSAVGKRYLL
jgi:7,8-dihydropterin-6-yl-methyl-4-(beta-D-ribofuranosyl)aminobenzene 5'-phosphate synthase